MALLEDHSELAPHACDRDARELLEREGARVDRIIRVHPDAILYVNQGGKVMTAWLTRRGAFLNVHVEPGMPAERTDAARLLDAAATGYTAS